MGNALQQHKKDMVTMPENSGITAEKRGRPFAPGTSGNPGGRPKRTPEQRDALEAIRNLSPIAADVMREILLSARSSEAAKIRVCELILDRTYGKASTQVSISTGSFDALNEAFAALAIPDPEQ